MHDTLDFRITPFKGNEFHLEVFDRENKKIVAKSTFAYDLSYLTDFEINQLVEFYRNDPLERFEQLKKFGSNLYQKVFTPEIEKIWKGYKEKYDFTTLCIRISPELKKLEDFPWETLYNGAEFISAGAKTTLTRLPLDIELIDNLPEIPLPIKMFALISSPLDLKENERLAIEEEQEILLRATNLSSGRGRMQVTFEDEAKLNIIENSIESGFQIFHYSGHGIDPKSGGGLLLENLDGKKRPTSVDEFISSIQKGIKGIRVAVISGCLTARTSYSTGMQSLARGLIYCKIPAVVAMQFSITDKGGLIFAETFYSRLMEGQPVDKALTAARRLLLQNNEPVIQADALAPVLICSNWNPLKSTDKAEIPETNKQIINFNYYIRLPQLDYGFYGRRKEYRAVRDSIIYKNQRAVIIHGIGGIGKTALVSFTVSRLKKYFNFIYAFDCRKGTLAPEVILLELNRFLERNGNHSLNPLMHQPFSPEELATYMSQVLTQLQLLIIFDNFETQLTYKNGIHEITDENLGSFLKTLIKTTGTGSHFLFTSRYIFDVDEKRVGTINDVPLVELSRPEALGMMQNLPHLSPADFEDKLNAYVKFGGHPYAFVVLDRCCRQKTLKDTLNDTKNIQAELEEFIALEIAYTKISEQSRELLNRFAAYRQPVTNDALHWVIGKRVELTKDFLKQIDRSKLPEKYRSITDDEQLKLFQDLLPEKRYAEGIDELIAELINWGLITPIIEDGNIHLLSVHSLVREFCKSKAVEDSWKKNLINSADYYLNNLKNLNKEKKSFTDVFNEIEAFELLFEAGEFEAAAGLILKISQLLSRWGLDRLLESFYSRIIFTVNRNTQSFLIHNWGNLFLIRGDYKTALEKYETSLKISEEIGDHIGIARSLHQIGMINQNRYDYKTALEKYEASLKILEDIGDRAGVGGSLHQIARINEIRGDYKTALEKYEASIKIKEEIGDRDGIAYSLHQIGMINEIRGDYKTALEKYNASLKILEEIGDRAGIARSLHQIGMINQYDGDYKAALKKYEVSLKILKEIDDRPGIAISLHQIGMINQYDGDYKTALEKYEASLKIKEEIGDRNGVSITCGAIGQLFLNIGKFPEAFEYFLITLQIALEIESPYAQLAMNDLKKLRKKWGQDQFDKAWKIKFGEDIPERLKE